MKILKLEIDGFGRFRNFCLEFDPHMTVITGLNEAGKTTLHECIRALLFGMRRARGAASFTDRWSDLKPWDKGSYAAAMVLEHEGKTYRLKRDFEKDPCGYEILTEEDLKPVPSGEEFYTGLLGGMTESFYDNTVSMSQSCPASDEGMAAELHEYILNMNTSGNRALSTERAAEYLMKQKNERLASIDEDCARRYTAELAELKKLEKEAERPEYADHTEENRRLSGELLEAAGKNAYRQEILSSEVADNDSIRKNMSIFSGLSWVCAGLSVMGLAVTVYTLLVRSANYISLLTGIQWLYIMAGGGALFVFFALLFIILRVHILRLSDTVRVDEEEELLRLKKEEKELGEKTGRLNESIKKQNTDRIELMKKLARINVLKEECALLKEQTERNDILREEIEAIDYALQTMDELAESHKNSFGRYLNKCASDNLKALTGGAYDSISIDEKLGACLNTRDGMIPIRQVSCGTRDQVYLAVRLAAASLVGGNRLPLILDDSFVNYDENRMNKAITWLSETYEGQIIIFTCHKGIAEMPIPHKTVTL